MKNKGGRGSHIIGSAVRSNDHGIVHNSPTTTTTTMIVCTHTSIHDCTTEHVPCSCQPCMGTMVYNCLLYYTCWLHSELPLHVHVHVRIVVFAVSWRKRELCAQTTQFKGLHQIVHTCSIFGQQTRLHTNGRVSLYTFLYCFQPCSIIILLCFTISAELCFHCVATIFANRENLNVV